MTTPGTPAELPASPDGPASLAQNQVNAGAVIEQMKVTVGNLVANLVGENATLVVKIRELLTENAQLNAELSTLTAPAPEPEDAPPGAKPRVRPGKGS